MGFRLGLRPIENKRFAVNPFFRMKVLAPLEKRHLEAAQGWLDLGNPHEAQLELQRIPLNHQCLPDILNIRWQTSARLKQWQECLGIARGYTSQSPESEVAWLFLSTAFKCLGRVDEAYDTLGSVIDSFPDSAVMPLQLACYGCELGRLLEAKLWLDVALRRNPSARFRGHALREPELAPLWRTIAAMS